MFKELGLDLNAVDKRGSTPLLWACYSLSETALSYLLCWNPDLNVQDIEGFTALHLAVRSVEKLGSTRPVRALLIKGANPSIRDINNKLAIDYLENFEGPEYKEDLATLLRNNNYFACQGGSLRKVTKSKTTAILYFVFQIIGILCQFSYVFPFQDKILSIISIALNVLTFVLYFYVMFKNPGKI